MRVRGHAVCLHTTSVGRQTEPPSTTSPCPVLASVGCFKPGGLPIGGGSLNVTAREARGFTVGRARSPRRTCPTPKSPCVYVGRARNRRAFTSVNSFDPRARQRYTAHREWARLAFDCRCSFRRSSGRHRLQKALRPDCCSYNSVFLSTSFLEWMLF